MICFVCTHPANYDYLSMAWLRKEDKLCEDHKLKAGEMTPPKEEPKKYVIKPQAQFVPPIPKEPIKNWNEREPGSDDF